jgi:sec-independent protein translocase protein TatB
MFGIGFTELLLISIIAILFLGPDKLPQALVEMAKFIKGVKKTIGDAKNSLEEEMKIADLKEEALNYKKQLNDATAELKGFKNLSLEDLDDVNYNDDISQPSSSLASPTKKDAYAEAPREAKEVEENITTQVEPKNETVTFKKPKKEKITKKEKPNTKGDA